MIKTKKITRQSLFPELEKEFGCEIDVKPDYHRCIQIMRDSGRINVDKRFEFLDIKVQKLMVCQVIALRENSSNPNYEKIADKIAIDKMLKMYPDVEYRYWVKAFGVLFETNDSSSNFSRMQSLVDSMYYLSKGKINYDEGGYGDGFESTYATYDNDAYCDIPRGVIMPDITERSYLTSLNEIKPTNFRKRTPLMVGKPTNDVVTQLKANKRSPKKKKSGYTMSA